MASLIAQLIRRKDHPDNPRLRGPILVIDMKGTDAYAFHAVREACRKEGRPFRFFASAGAAQVVIRGKH